MATIQASSNDIRLWLQQGLRAAHDGEKAEARRCFQAARDLDPNNIVALLWLAWLAPNRRESLALFCRVLELDPDNKRAQAGLEWVRGRLEYETRETGPAQDISVAKEMRNWQSSGAPGNSALVRDRQITSPPRDSEKPARRIASDQAIMRRSRGLRVVLRQVTGILVTLLVILLMTLFGLIVAERGRERVPAEPLSAANEALARAAEYITHHPTTYHWHREEVSSLELVVTTLARSGALLLLALIMATVVGVPLGVAAALSRRERGAPLVLFLSILGISTPSFLLAMVIGVVNIQIHRRFGIPALPPNGFGWDTHIVMPALVLAARPLAQIVQITYVSVSGILGQDYIRVAQAKGLGQRIVLNRHTLRNAFVPILTTIGTSLRLSLASLPVVEFFFIWPGVGLTLLLAIELGNASLVADLIVAIGLLFLLINLALELIYPMLDPRYRRGHQTVERQTQQSWQDRIDDVFDVVAAWWNDVRRKLPGSQRTDSEREPPKPLSLPNAGNATNAEENDVLPVSQPSHRRFYIVFGNPILVISLLMVLVFFGLALFGEHLTEASPFQTHGVKIIDGEIGAPPFPPSSVFPWGTDPLGRDLQALVLAGARQTLILALFAMIARMLVGTLLGMMGGWQRGGRFDRLLTGAIGVWAAFPVTLFAIIAILALGIEKGMGVFVVVLCVVGWAEIAQFVRGQVTGIKPQLHIEAARALGTRTGGILNRHVLPLSIIPKYFIDKIAQGEYRVYDSKQIVVPKYIVKPDPWGKGYRVYETGKPVLPVYRIERK